MQRVALEYLQQRILGQNTYYAKLLWRTSLDICRVVSYQFTGSKNLVCTTAGGSHQFSLCSNTT